MDVVVQQMLEGHLAKIETKAKRDVLVIFGAIMFGLEHQVRDAVERLAAEAAKRKDSKPKLCVILDTAGGIVEVVERMVTVIREHYHDVQFVIPDKAMSAGTIFAMSGDSICMDYFSVLGPIDPQVVKDGKLVPALSYLLQYDRLIAKDRDGLLTAAEYAMLAKLDLAELHQYEQARKMSADLLEDWLARYKFKDWTQTASTRKDVTEEKRRARAGEIAKVLSDNQRWCSHARGISRNTLQSDEIKLKIDDLGADRELQQLVREYHHCLTDLMVGLGRVNMVQTRMDHGSSDS